MRLTATDLSTYLIVFGVALTAALIATPIARLAAIRFHILDHPGSRKVQIEPVPYLGGVAIIVSFLVAIGAGTLVHGLTGHYGQVAAILAGAGVVAAMGLWDDIRGVAGWVKAVVMIPVAVALYATGVRAKAFQYSPLDFVLTIGWICGITNAVNFLDNMDGLTAGIAAIAGAYFAALAALSGQFVVASLSAALAGAALGFLRHNRTPARIYMGDAGTMFLGLLLAALGLKIRFTNLRQVAFFVPFTVLGVPILDTAVISASRVRRGRSPLSPGLDHVSHRLVRLGIPNRGVVELHYLAGVSTGWLGVVIAYTRPTIAYILMGWLLVVGGSLGALLLRVPPEG
jgi:UDP-GlcNAc:undecaprenyl-phosphate GlcNAc-1-phosphate transferase